MPIEIFLIKKIRSGGRQQKNIYPKNNMSVACRKTTYPLLKQDGVLVQKKYWRHAQNLAKAGVCLMSGREGGRRQISNVSVTSLCPSVSWTVGRLHFPLLYSVSMFHRHNQRGGEGATNLFQVFPIFFIQS